MTVITTRIIVAPDGTITVATPLPAGEHAARITLLDGEPAATTAQGRPSVLDLPVHDGPWDDGTSLRREDLYDDRMP